MDFFQKCPGFDLQKSPVSPCETRARPSQDIAEEAMSCLETGFFGPGLEHRTCGIALYMLTQDQSHVVFHTIFQHRRLAPENKQMHQAEPSRFSLRGRPTAWTDRSVPRLTASEVPSS